MIEGPPNMMSRFPEVEPHSFDWRIADLTEELARALDAKDPKAISLAIDEAEGFLGAHYWPAYHGTKELRDFLKIAQEKLKELQGKYDPGMKLSRLSDTQRKVMSCPRCGGKLDAA